MKTQQSELAGIKRRVSGAALKLAGVSGVGLPTQGITVYLENDSAQLRKRVEGALKPLGLDVPIHFEVSGKFRPS